MELYLGVFLFAAIQFEESSLTVDNGAGTVELTVTRDVSSSSLPQSVTVSFLTVEQYAQRDRSSPTNCQLTTADLGLVDVDPAEGWCMLSII